MTADPRPDNSAKRIAVILVDHGSKVEASNQLLDEIVKAYRRNSDWAIVQPAHMELAEPSIAAAFASCVKQAAELVVVMPYFLGPGRHSSQDIPRLTAAAASAHPGVEYLVAGPLGQHELMLKVIDSRLSEALEKSER